MLGPGELVHEVNLHIREMAGEFAATSAADEPQEYLCECGCGRWVPLTVPEFDALESAGEAVVLGGHLSRRVRAARETARELGEDAAALRAEARQARTRREELRAKRPKPPNV